MAILNTGRVVRHANGGSIFIGADTVANIVAGTLEYTRPRPETWVHKDQGALAGVYQGDAQPGRWKFTVKKTNAAAGLIALLTAVHGTGSSGEPTKFTMKVRTPNFGGATSGNETTLTDCYVTGVTDKAAGGADSDDLEFEGQFIGGWTELPYTP
jgi:hypothetical protein